MSFALVLTLFAGWSLLAQETTTVNADGTANDPADRPNAVFTQDGSAVRVGDWTARNLWLMRTTGLPTKNSDFWRYFMHGIRDDKSTPIAWPHLFNKPDDAKQWLADEKILLCKNIKDSTFPILWLSGPQTLALPRPVLSLNELAELKGQKLRFHIWLKGEDCGSGSLWDNAPALIFSLKDGLDNLISTSESLFKTRGTFPWFCYYIEVTIPGILNSSIPKTDAGNQDQTTLAFVNQSNGFLSGLLGEELVPPGKLPPGGGLYLTLKNTGGGKAFFSTLAWENITAQKVADRSTWTDSVTGSRAPNPDYDEFPLHLFFGLDANKKWNFLYGNNAFTNITTIDGLEKYLSTATHDWFHCLYGVANLGYVHATGTVLKQCNEFENGWTKILLDRLLRWQDLRTGLWGNGDTPNLLITQAVANKCFSPKAIIRADQPQQATPWLAVQNSLLPNAEALAESILSSRVQDTAGRVRGWNRFAFQDSKLGQEQRDNISDLGSTCAAVQILAQIASQQHSPTLQKTLQNALYDAWEFVLQNFFSQDYLWRQNDISWAVTTPTYMLTLLNALPWLEQRIDKTLAVPQFEAREIPGEKIRVSWDGQKARYASLRIYAAPASLKTESINERHLVAILNKNSKNFFATDPLLLLGKILFAANKRWGITTASEGAEYLASKMSLLSRAITSADAGKELIFPVPTAASADSADGQETITPEKLKYYLTAVTPYNVMTPFTEILTDMTGEITE